MFITTRCASRWSRYVPDGVTAFVAASIIAGNAVIACAQTPDADAAARIGDRLVSLQELDDNWREFDPNDHGEAEQALYDGRKAAFDRLVAGILIEEAAAKQGVSAMAYLEAEVARRRKPVTAAQIEAFYKANTSQMRGADLSAMQEPIRAFLGGQRDTAAREELVAELRESGPPVRLAIEPPRRTIAVTEVDPVQGPETAPVTVVEFSDFQCPFCNRVTPTLKRLRETYGDQIRVVWKDFPIASIHPQAHLAAEAAHCAGEQERYWEYHDQIFANQSALSADDLKAHAEAIGIEADPFNSCLDSGRHAERVLDGIEEGVALGVDSTPTLFVNGRRVTGAQPYEVFESLVEDELTRAGR